MMISICRFESKRDTNYILRTLSFIVQCIEWCFRPIKHEYYRDKEQEWNVNLEWRLLRKLRERIKKTRIDSHTILHSSHCLMFSCLFATFLPHTHSYRNFIHLCIAYINPKRVRISLRHALLYARQTFIYLMLIQEAKITKNSREKRNEHSNQ